MTNSKMASEDKNSLIYLLAGFGLGALIGAIAGILFAPKAGNETREELATRIKEAKHKSEEWIAEQRAKRSSKAEDTADVGA